MGTLGLFAMNHILSISCNIVSIVGHWILIYHCTPFILFIQCSVNFGPLQVARATDPTSKSLYNLLESVHN